MASKDFLDACKLKMKDQPTENYDDLYASAAKNAVPVNFGSIAMVCGQNTKAETVYTVLKDFMGRVVSNSKDRGLLLKIARVGYLMYKPSEPGYLSFTDKSSDLVEDERPAQMQHETPAELSKKNVEALGSILDSLSHRLSTDGATLSVRSGFFSNMSVKTPRTILSNAQSTTSIARKDNYWQAFKRKLRHKTVDADNIFEAKSQTSEVMSTFDARQYKQVAEYGFDPANRDSKSMQPASTFKMIRKPASHCMEQPNLVLKSKHENESRFSGSSTASQQVLPYPFLQGLLSNIQKTSKRVVFPEDSNSKQEVFESVRKQIEDKALKKKTEKEQQLKEANDELDSWKKNMVEDRIATTNENLIRQVEFMQANDYLKK